MSSSNREVTIIGAGIVGVCCARFLQRAGFHVTVVDRVEPGESTSFGNAGMICSLEAALPLPSYRLLRDLPQMLLDPKSPLMVRWGYLPRMLPWISRFAKSAAPARRMTNAKALASLLKDTLHAYDALVEDSDADRLIVREGGLSIYEGDASFRKDAEEREMLRSLGCRLEELSAAELQELEPSLAPIFKHGVFIPDCGHTLNPFSLTKALAGDVLEAQGRFVRAEVKDIELGPDGPRTLHTDSDPIHLRSLVLAGGAWSGDLARRLGSPVPLDTERGYHVMFKGLQTGLTRESTSRTAVAD